MAEPSSELSASQIVDGFQIPAMFSAEAFRSAVRYKPRSDDVFIVTYPKCGTTWTQHTVSLIFSHGEPTMSGTDFFSAAPFLEMTGAEAAETMPRPGAIKVHLPFHLTPWSEKAKYLYVTRNPKDCCVSYFHHMKNIPGHEFKGTFDQFFELFLSGKIDYEDYFDHLLGWYEHRNDPNVLFVTYEEMKENPAASVLKMASFIDDEKYAKPLREDPQKLNNVLQYSSFKHMKEVVNKAMDDLFKMTPEEAMKTNLPDQMKKNFKKFEKKDGGEASSSVNFVRKGIIGDWRNHLSEDQSKRMDQKFAERTKGTEIENYWKEYM
ncbi:amine sulfotransferase [Trichonephila clavipes]|uniref:Amine sulfotransferase n=1 Tax=Trichonephila clavipes TaxID=2585209 RepID=A0A8X6RRD7_TRICX|nr:amine sulfotransferase [Trichonephila clavipes]